MKLLVALISSLTAGLTGAVKSYNGAADRGGNPWLGLMTSSWSLAGKSEDEQSKGLAELSDHILQLASSGALQNPDPTQQQAISSIRDIIVNMEGAVNASIQTSQQNIDNAKTALDQCTPPNATDKNTWLGTLNRTGAEVRQCRDIEYPLYQTYIACQDGQVRCSNTTACCVSIIQPEPRCPDFNGILPNPGAEEQTCNGKVKCRANELAAAKQHFQTLLNAVLAAETACENSMSGCPNPPATCTAELAAWTTKKNACNGEQVEFEEQYCELARNVDNGWGAYNNCYTNAKTQLKNTEDQESNLLPSRQQEWRGLLRIHCLLDALESANVTASLEGCIAKTYTASDWPHIALTLYWSTYPDKATCTEQLESPGTTTFNNKHYSTVPAVLLPANLNSHDCVSRLTGNCPVAAAGLGPVAS
eukprot:TRINITY_DN6761_c1_g1_i1.p1 TRINITY_DN6761_c1_g1~~TRINITY_DN6761_c1_g1_i1.p1  ORF type:complete len:419 (-),score=80.36 TRINITY_DN6761_c1_g1_i1:91-1347(-)